MKEADRYVRFVQWSDEDQAYIGYCPGLYFGGVCHGDSEIGVFAQLCEIVRAEVEHRSRNGEQLPEPHRLPELKQTPEELAELAQRTSEMERGQNRVSQTEAEKHWERAKS